MKKLELLESEWTILEVVWDQEPCTAPAVQETLLSKKHWAYTTVKTMMDRMVKKGLLKTEKLRNLYIYSSAISPAQAKKSEIMRTIKRAFNDSMTPMMQFLIENDELSEKECTELERLIRNRKKRKSSRKKK